MNSHNHGDSTVHTNIPIGFRICGFAILGVLMAVIFAFAFGWLVMLLWNHLMPSLFGLTTISYWQSVGLLVLAKLLFGGFGHSAGYQNKGHPHHIQKTFWCRSGNDGGNRDDGLTAREPDYRRE